MAAQNGHTTIVQKLLAHPDINLATNEGFTLLAIVAENGHTDTFAELMVHPHIHVNPMNEREISPLYMAAQNGYTKIVEQLLAIPYIDVNTVLPKGFTPLHGAVQNGHTDVISLLLNHKDINVNQPDDEGMTALHIAAQNDHPQVVKQLLDYALKAIQKNKGNTNVIIDIDEVINYFKVAIVDEAANAQYCIGLCYQKYLDGANDTKKAMQYFQMAAEQGHVEVQYSLGMYYRDEVKDANEAAKYFQQASKQGHIGAHYNLGMYYQDTVTNAEEAAKYFKLAADQGDKNAQLQLALCYQQGLGIKQDDYFAIRYFQMAAHQGVEAAYKELDTYQKNNPAFYHFSCGYIAFINGDDSHALISFNKAISHAHDPNLSFFEGIWKDYTHSKILETAWKFKGVILLSKDISTNTADLDLSREEINTLKKYKTKIFQYITTTDFGENKEDENEWSNRILLSALNKDNSSLARVLFSDPAPTLFFKTHDPLADIKQELRKRGVIFEINPGSPSRKADYPEEDNAEDFHNSL